VVAPEARVSPAAIALPLLLTMLLPLGVGLAVRSRYPTLALRVRPWLGKLSEVALVVLIVSTVIANFGGIRDIISEGAIVAPLGVILGAFGIGYALGREYRGGHVVLGLGTAQRNVAAAMVVATQGLDDSKTVVMVVVASLVELAVLFPIAWALKRRRIKRERVAHA
jgi:bile acid:Na+ symporter, BASS family